ncbi:MAG: hypothetical protein WCD25_26905, partial [Pseudolabrys sp.]
MPDEVVVERLAQYCGGRRKLTETETGPALNGAAMNLIRGYIGFVGLLVSIIGFMILAYAWADG